MADSYARQGAMARREAKILSVFAEGKTERIDRDQ